MTREEAIKWLDKLYMEADITDEYGDMVNMQPYEEAFDMAIKALEIITKTKGHWIKEKSIHGWGGYSYQCSVCGRSIHLDTTVEDLTDYPYCRCGARTAESEE